MNSFVYNTWRILLRSICISLLLVSLLSCGGKDEQKNKRGKDDISKKSLPVTSTIRKTPVSLFQYHLRILDSAAAIPSNDTMFNCCYNSVNFMEVHTGIIADVESDYAGATGFKQDDLRRWHAWYDSTLAIENRVYEK